MESEKRTQCRESNRAARLIFKAEKKLQKKKTGIKELGGGQGGPELCWKRLEDGKAGFIEIDVNLTRGARGSGGNRNQGRRDFQITKKEPRD